MPGHRKQPPLAGMPAEEAELLTIRNALRDDDRSQEAQADEIAREKRNALRAFKEEQAREAENWCSTTEWACIDQISSGVSGHVYTQEVRIGEMPVCPECGSTNAYPAEVVS